MTSTPPSPAIAKPAIAIGGSMPSFAGSITEKSGVVSGVLQNMGGRCIGGADIPVTGSLKAGTLTLTSSAVAGETLSLTATMSADDATITAGTYTIAGDCADKGTITGSRLPALHGTFSGTFTSDSGATIHTSIKVAQTATADAHGLFHLTATATFSNSPCFSKGTVTDQVNGSIVLGPFVGVHLTTDEKAGSIVTASGIYDPTTKTMIASYFVAGGTCDGDQGSGTLTLQ